MVVISRNLKNSRRILVIPISKIDNFTILLRNKEKDESYMGILPCFLLGPSSLFLYIE
jgi:hypothetical protein